MNLNIDTKTTLTVLFVTSILIANITAAKLAWFQFPYLGGVAVPAGFVAFGVAYLCSDLLVELEGREYAHTVVNTTVIGLIIGWGLIYVAVLLPTAPFYENHDAYTTTLGASANIVLASIVTLLISQHADVELFAWIRHQTGSGHRWARNLISTSVSQFIDTTIFIFLGFTFLPLIFGGEVLWGIALASTIIGQYLAKLVIAGLDTPLFYTITSITPRKQKM